MAFTCINIAKRLEIAQYLIGKISFFYDHNQN